MLITLPFFPLFSVPLKSVRGVFSLPDPFNLAVLDW